MKYKILDINKPNINGIIYPKEVIQKALDSDIIKEQLTSGGIPIIKKTEHNIELLMNGTILMNNIIGFATCFNLTDDELSVDVLFMKDNYSGNIYPCGKGDTSFKEGLCYVDKYELLGLYGEGDE